MKSTFLFFGFVIFICIVLMSCTSSSTDSDPGAILPKLEQIGPCQDVITETKISTYNQNQTDFQVKASGYNRRCMTEVKVNGQATQAEVIGHSAITVLPNLKFTSVAEKATGVYVFKMNVQQMANDDYLKILAKLGVPGTATSYFAYEIMAPSYVHFERSLLYPISNVKHTGPEISFEVRARDSTDVEVIKGYIAKLFVGENVVDLLWAPVSDIVSQLTVGPHVKSISWSRSDTVSILESLVLDDGGVNAAIFEAIAEYADDWKINQIKLNQRMPELLSFATAQWQNPVPTDANSKRLLYYLKYISYQDSSIPQKPVLDVFERVQRFHDSTRATLQTAIDYTAGRTHSFEQFEFLVLTSGQMHSAFGGATWSWANAIANRVSYDPAIAKFVGDVAANMFKRKMAVAPENLEGLFAKVYGGLSETNSKVYFSAFDFFRTNVKSTAAEAELASDTFVLSNHWTEETSNYYKELFNWLEDGLNFQFTESTQLIAEITRDHALTPERAAAFRKMYRWLAVTIPLAKAEAIPKIIFYMNSLNLSNETFGRLKAEYEVLIQQSLPPAEALRLAEEKILIPVFEVKKL